MFGLSDYLRMLGQVDAVSIAVPTGEHYKVARDFLAAGMDVLIEKPICAKLKEADELIELTRKNKIYSSGRLCRKIQSRYYGSGKSYDQSQSLSSRIGCIPFLSEVRTWM